MFLATNIILSDDDRAAMDVLCEPSDDDMMTQWEARQQLVEEFSAMLDRLVYGEYDKGADRNPEIL